MNRVYKKYKISPELLALFAALIWLVIITGLHFYITSEQSLKRKFRIGYLPITCHLLLPIAMERDRWFRGQVDAIKFSSWPDMIESIKGGELDAAFILAPIALSLMKQGVPVRISLLGHRNGTGLVVSERLGIQTGPDLRGKTIAIPIRFSTQNLALQEFLSKNAVSSSEVNLVELPPPDMPSALASGAIDAYIVGEPYASQAEMAGTGLIMHRVQDLWPGFISSVLIVQDRALTGEKALVDRIISTLYSQGTWIESHRTKAARIGADFFGLPEALLLHVLRNRAERVNYRRLLPDREEFMAIGRLMVKYGLQDQVPPCRIYLKWR